MPGIRPATAPDLPRLLELARRSAMAAQWSQAEYARLFAPETQQKRVALVLEEENQVAGFIVARPMDAEWEIESVVVSESARRRGLGTLLLDALIAWARRQGGREIFLEVRESNQAARALYRKRAFVEAGRRKQYYENPAEDALVLRLDLSS